MCVCVGWVGFAAGGPVHANKGKVAFYQNSIISMEGGWGLGGVGYAFSFLKSRFGGRWVIWLPLCSCGVTRDS